MESNPELKMELLEVAESIARKAHAGQKEESTGDDYIHHIERVVALVDGDDAKAVAWLHDVLEDTSTTSDDLELAAIPEHILQAVEILTRKESVTYKDYIAYIHKIGDPLVIAVKIADLKDHLRPNCPESLRPRYEQAFSVLQFL